MVVLESEMATADLKLFRGRHTLTRIIVLVSKTIELAHSVGHLALLSTRGNSRRIPSIALTVSQHVKTEFTATTMIPKGLTDLQTSVHREDSNLSTKTGQWLVKNTLHYPVTKARSLSMKTSIIETIGNTISTDPNKSTLMKGFMRS